jgi:hypothetical protein
MTELPNDPEIDNWKDVTRAEAWAGEIRVNLVRLVAILLFYARHLLEFFMSDPAAPVRGRYHVAVTVVVLAWVFEAIILHIRLSRRHYHDWTKYVAVVWDAAMITLLCVIAGGPKTPLMLLFFALIVSAPLRLSLELVYAATASAMAGYLVVLGYYAWYKIGYQIYYSTPGLRIPRSEEVIWLLSLLVCGLMAGQGVRQVRRLTQRQVMIATDTSAGPMTRPMTEPTIEPPPAAGEVR